jgi:hypothetical protein
MDWSKVQRVEGDPDLVRGPNGEITMVNRSTYDAYMAGLEAEQAKEAQVGRLQDDVAVLKSEMSDIKSLLLTLVQNQKGLNYDD